METCFRRLWMTVVLASIMRRSVAVGPVIRCEPCDAGARILCKPLPKDCAERVREPGCGCCTTCALAFGKRCGVYTGRCGSGMTCQHQPGETKPLQALLEGRGQCANATIKRPVATLINERQENDGGIQEEERNTTAPVLQASFSTSRPPVGSPRIPHHPPLLHPVKAEVIRREQLKRAQSYKMEQGPGALSTDQHNFSLESKQDPEYALCREVLLYLFSETRFTVHLSNMRWSGGPCRREMESILNGLKITDILNPRGFRIPNCDKKGFYKKKQVWKSYKHTTGLAKSALH
ncbi:unnamed protein product [Oncorhynchus mykiss]|uniref:IGFBP N-terminal domain-containing protein n=1 Tax=Oncorhynchus mykiss TaxID=8022 RepID=A0A060VX20_ONCMY|nr:unnamed protein product [Oncorhynchus mykiss]